MGTGQAGVANGPREQIDRFASFAERYIIERASTFRPGNEKQDAWLALQDAQRVYDMIQRGAAMRNSGAAGYAATQTGSLQAAFANLSVKELTAIVTDCQAKGHPVPYGVIETLRKIFGYWKPPTTKGHNNGPTI